MPERRRRNTSMRSVHISIKVWWDAQHRRQQRRKTKELARLVVNHQLDPDMMPWPGRRESSCYW